MEWNIYEIIYSRSKQNRILHADIWHIVYATWIFKTITYLTGYFEQYMLHLKTYLTCIVQLYWNCLDKWSHTTSYDRYTISFKDVFSSKMYLTTFETAILNALLFGSNSHCSQWKTIVQRKTAIICKPYLKCVCVWFKCIKEQSSNFLLRHWGSQPIGCIVLKENEWP